MSARTDMVSMVDRVFGVTGSLGRKDSLDRFYTKPEIAEECLTFLPELESFGTVIEPSAGSGSFSNLIPGCLAFDVAPGIEGVVQQDWFDYERVRDGSGGRVLVVGNPPFGVRNGTAVRFINHAAGFADVVAFVLPVSFMKGSVQARVDRNLHLLSNHVLSRNSFLLNGEPYDVPCVFQVWEWREGLRPAPVRLSAKRFRFVRKDESPDLFVQRIGGNAGRVGVEVSGRSVQSNYFVKLDDVADLPRLLSALESLEYADRLYSVGPKSVSQQEILKELLVADSYFVSS